MPEFACLSNTLHLIDVPRENNGQILRVLMNAELDQAVAFLSPPQKEAEQMETDFIAAGRAGEEHWRWHHRIAQRVAAQLDPQQFGVEAFYLIGSTKNATAGPSRDIDLMLHFSGTEELRRELSSPRPAMILVDRNGRQIGSPLDQPMEVRILRGQPK